MKKCITLLLVVIMCFLTGCGYLAHKEYYNNIEDYQKIWELSGFRHGYEDKSPLFPEKIDNLAVSEFLCRYDEQYPLGEGVQILLKILYDDDSFNTELKRIADNAVKNDNDFTNDQFSAYVVRLGEDECWEYALIDETQKSVYYIFLHNLPEKEIEINKTLMPSNYVDYGEESLSK